MPQVFREHIRQDLANLSASHELIQISPKFLKSAPWPVAQKALLRMSAFKSPLDKLNCIVEVCSVADWHAM